MCMFHYPEIELISGSVLLFQLAVWPADGVDGDAEFRPVLDMPAS